MPWLKLLHISAVIVWCGALLYLPALVAAAAAARSRPAAAESTGEPIPPLRAIYTGVATPAALLAITSGTWIFATQGPLASWLMAKLALVGLLVLGHGVCGLLVLRSERAQTAGLRAASLGVGVGTLVGLLGIAWLVLRKPGWP